jgi:hypothetical protein
MEIQSFQNHKHGTELIVHHYLDGHKAISVRVKSDNLSLNHGICFFLTKAQELTLISCLTRTRKRGK